MQELNIYRHISVKKRNHCVVCETKLFEPLMQLPKFPLTEIYIKQPAHEKLGFVDQEFHLCEKCGHGQLKYVIDPDFLYGSSYKTRTSTSSSAVSAIDKFLVFIHDTLKNRPVKTIFEIGCNDLYTLKKLKHKADKLYGIDPVLKGKEKLFQDDKIKVIGDFFENVDLKRLGVTMDLVLSSHTLEHIEKPKQLIQRLLDVSTDKTIFFFQFPGFEELVRDAHFDQIFHQHLNYFSLESVLYLLDKVGAELVDFRINPYHWGTLMIAFRKKRRRSNLNLAFRKRARTISRNTVRKQFQIFKDCMDLTAKRIDAFTDKTLYGYGAALMLPVLEYYTHRISRLRYIIDDDPSKAGFYYLNVPVQIKPLNQIKEVEKSVVVVTAINSMQAKRSILGKLMKLNVEKIIIPDNLI